MKATDIRQMTTAEIESNLSDYENTLVTLRYNHFVQPVENPSRMRKIRQDIARMYTILRERELQG